MLRISAWLILTSAILVMTIVITPHYSSAQHNPVLEAGFGGAVVAINNAEAAGASAKEIAPLVALLNKALELNQEASNLPTNQKEQRNNVISTVDQILTKVTYQAKGLAATSAQRSYTNKIITYVAGLLLAVTGTFAHVFCVELYQRYRIKRAFQMRVKVR